MHGTDDSGSERVTSHLLPRRAEPAMHMQMHSADAAQRVGGKAMQSGCVAGEAPGVGYYATLEPLARGW